MHALLVPSSDHTGERRQDGTPYPLKFDSRRGVSGFPGAIRSSSALVTPTHAARRRRGSRRRFRQLGIFAVSGCLHRFITRVLPLRRRGRRERRDLPPSCDTDERLTRHAVVVVDHRLRLGSYTSRRFFTTSATRPRGVRADPATPIATPCVSRTHLERYTSDSASTLRARQGAQERARNVEQSIRKRTTTLP